MTLIKSHKATRKTSTGPYTIYSLTCGKFTYIGKTCEELQTRLGKHINFCTAGRHVNFLIQDLYDAGKKFTITALSVHDDNNQARIAEDRAIKAIPVKKSLNLRQKRKEPNPRPEGRNSNQIIRDLATTQVNMLLAQGWRIMDACYSVAAQINYSHLTVYSWIKGMPEWNGTRIKFILKEIK